MKKHIFLYGFAAIYCGLLVYSLRFADPEFRPLEYLYETSAHRFYPNRSMSMRAIGDLGRETWIRALQVEKQVTFTTDAWGFRNQGSILRPEIVVVGDSYLIGSGLTDVDTLTAKMGQLLGTAVYNFGVYVGDFQLFFLTDPRFEDFSTRVVIWAPASREIKPRALIIQPPPEEPLTLAQSFGAGYKNIGEAFAHGKERLNHNNHFSVQARYLYNGLLYRALGHRNVIYPDGLEGAPVLALGVEAQGLLDSPAEREVLDTISMVSLVSDYLAERGLHFIYCPIPESATIYPELFQDRDRIVTPSFLDVLISGLDEAGVVTVDLRPVFAADKTPYLYLPDDSHWNSRAVEIAARALSRRVSILGQAPVNDRKVVSGLLMQNRDDSNLYLDSM